MIDVYCPSWHPIHSYSGPKGSLKKYSTWLMSHLNSEFILSNRDFVYINGIKSPILMLLEDEIFFFEWPPSKRGAAFRPRPLPYVILASENHDPGLGQHLKAPRVQNLLKSFGTYYWSNMSIIPNSIGNKESYNSLKRFVPFLRHQI